MCASAFHNDENDVSEILADLSETFPTLYQGWIPKRQLRDALQRAGFKLAGCEYRDLEEEFTRPAYDYVCLETLSSLLRKLLTAEGERKRINKKNALRERADLRVRYLSKTFSGKCTLQLILYNCKPFRGILLL
ncbi:unnamed protein product [Schistocephalus solidus]|uniref:SAM_MT_RSMB_NOP domain-containing protein n=1 Tax=Schistocephalus solidus TaxID=70667 RepID=A0A183T6R5_SCHSO|nr:unnamed protein product [Schistocephalus solidus]